MATFSSNFTRALTFQNVACREQKQKDLIANIDVVFEAVSIEHCLAPGDLPDPSIYRRKLQVCASQQTDSLSLPLPPFFIN